MKSSSIKHADQDCQPEMLVAVGASAGGLKEIVLLVEQLPSWFRGTMIVASHRKPAEDNTLAMILANCARVDVIEPVDEEALECTTIYVGKAEETVEVDDLEFDVAVDMSAYARIHRIDDLFKSVAESAGRNAVGIVLSGMLSDGVDGLEAIQKAGGFCIVQRPSDAEFDSMPNNALARLTPDFVGTTEEISSMLMELALKRSSNE
jgi:two-component system chemotaxis response regulator CheB